MGYPIFGPQVRWGTPFLVDAWTHLGAYSRHLGPLWRKIFDPPALLGKLTENQRLLLENLLSVYVGHLPPI